MKISKLYRNLLHISTTEFKTVVESAEILYSHSKIPWKVRIQLCDSSYIDVYYSVHGKYSYHWNRLDAGSLYRHDNACHSKWKDISTFPKHFHDGREDNVVPSHIPDDPEEALRELLRFAMVHISRGV